MPIRTNPTITYGRDWLTRALDHLVAAVTPAPLDGPVLHLMGAAGFNPTPDTTLDDLNAVEAAFSGYTTGSLFAGGVVTSPQPGLGQLYTAVYNALDPGGGDPYVPDTVTGWYMENDTRFVAGGMFPAVAMAVIGDWIGLDVLIAIPFRASNIG
jgi:hypothetical protein